MLSPMVSTLGAPSLTMMQILAGYVVCGYDVADAGDITITGAGVSNHVDSIGTYDVLQATDANRPLYTNSGQLSYYDGSTGSRNLRSAVGTDLTGGSMCLISVSKYAAAAPARCLLGVGSASTSRTRIHGDSAVVRDSVAEDLIAGPAQNSNINIHILRNDVGVVRKYHVNGGAGTAGARTTATNQAHTIIGILANSIGSSAANARAYFNAVCLTVPPVSVLNQLGVAYQARFASLGATWTTLS